MTSGYKVAGSKPTARNISAWKRIPVFARKHCRIIQRNGMRARLCLLSFGTEPPPMSVKNIVLIMEDRGEQMWGFRTSMTPWKPNLQDIRAILLPLMIGKRTLMRMIAVMFTFMWALAKMPWEFPKECFTSFRHIARFSAQFFFMFIGPVEKIGLKFWTMLVERHGVSECFNGWIGGCEREMPRNNPHWADGVPVEAH